MGNIGRDAMAMAAEEDRWPAPPGEGDGARYPPSSETLAADTVRDPERRSDSRQFWKTDDME